MERVNLSSSSSISRIIYGMWRLADDINTSSKHISDKVNLCLGQGITSFDQAAVYGLYSAEALFGEVLKANPSLRHKIEIVSKCGIVNPSDRYAGVSVSHYDTSREHIFNSVDASLKNMATDYLDLLLIHRQDPFLDHHETGKALDDLIKSGKVKEVGVSNFKPWDFNLLQSAMKSHLVTNQIEMSLAATDSFTNGDLAFHQERATTIMAWSPLGGGKLMKDKGILGKALKKIAVNQNVDIAAVAVAWLLAHPARICPVMGTNNLNRIAKISDAMNVKMDRESWFELYTASFNDGKLQWRLP
ncbi:oxidoreductase [Candidatus Pseudothioglobus singularis]|uniref:aldo/keto reductase n=1 Tax=Candidatus Pseudothioglobus singularis TaxID=1427364 RepID=UPI0008061FAF|nr:aldo/keto reductase [Candidatus Pseudothioglobus singularis]ANQ67018.1 oxidoreductase [Candidatus Pseudothioglobus singularis]